MINLKRIFSKCCWLSINVLTVSGLTVMEGQAQQSQATEDNELITLKQELAELSARLEHLERKQKQRAKSKPGISEQKSSTKPQWREDLKKDIQDSFTGTLPNSFKVPGFDTSIALDGFIKLDAITDQKVALTAPAYDYVLTPYIPVAGTTLHQRRGETHLTARTSQLGFITSTPLENGEIIETKFNGDFLGYTDVGTEQITNHYYFRVRYAYIKWNGWLFGQTDTTFRDLTAKGETVDALGPGSMASFRQAMLQYTWRPRSGVSWAFGVENPESDYLEKNDTTITRRNTQNGLVTTAGYGLDQFPDVATQFRIEWARGHISVRGLVREIRIRNGVDPEKHALGAGFGFSGHYKVFEKDKLLWSVNYGRGLGRYIVDLFSQAAVHSYQLGNLRPITALGYMFGYQHFWTPSLRSSALWSSSHSYNPGDIKLTGQEVNRLMRTGHLNLIWSPVPKWDLGIEASYASRKVEDTRKGVMHRYQAMAKYNF